MPAPTTCALVDEIRYVQRREVLMFLAAHPGASPERIGAALLLPLWSVRCRLAEIRGEPRPWVRKERPADPKPPLLKPKQ